jgi:regulator of protease activity HflC (stomatin/prohibitin superfamily)
MFTKKDKYGRSGVRAWVWLIPLVIVLAVVVFYSFSVKVRPAEVAIKVDLYGDDKGVRPEVLPTGRNFYNPITTDIVKYPAYVQNYRINDVSFKDTDGLSLSTDITIDYVFDAEEIPDIYVTYRQNAETIKMQYFDKWLKDAVVRTVSGKYTAEKLYSAGMNEFKTDILDALKDRFGQEGIVVRDVYLDDLQIPEQVMLQIQQKIEATQIAQRKERELQATQADVEKRVAEEEGKARSRKIEAQSRAEANQIINNSLTPEVLEFKRLELQKQAIEKWDGKMPLVVSDDQGMILDLESITGGGS